MWVWGSQLLLGQPQVRIAQSVHQDPYERFIERRLNRIGRGAQCLRLDFDGRDSRHRRNRRCAGIGVPSEIEDLAKAIAGLEDVQRVALERDASFPIDEETEAIAWLVLAHYDRARFNRVPACDAQHLASTDTLMSHWSIASGIGHVFAKY